MIVTTPHARYTRVLAGVARISLSEISMNIAEST